MDWDNKVGTVYCAGIPNKIEQRAQYMNDVVDTLFGKFSQAINYQKNGEFRGGIWDCGTLEKTVPTKPFSINSSINFPTKIFSLDEMIECDDAVIDTEIIEENHLLNEDSESTEVSAFTSCTDISVDSKNKRWLSQEFDNASLFSCHTIETTRKKSKKSVSDSITDKETLTKPLNITDKSLDSFSDETIKTDIGIADRASSLKITADFEKNKQTANSLMVSGDHNDVSDRIEDNGNTPEDKAAVKQNSKVEKWEKMTLLSCVLEQPQMKEESRNKSVKRSSKKTKSVDCDVEHEMKLKKYSVTHNAKNEEFKNRSHLKSIIPELFDFNEYETMNTDVYSDKQINMHSLKQKTSMVLQSSKKDISCTATQSDAKRDLSESKVESDNFKDNVLNQNQKENEVNLKKLLTTILNDKEIAEKITVSIVKLSEQKTKVNSLSKRVETLSDIEQTDLFPIMTGDKLHKEKLTNGKAYLTAKIPEDESQFKSVKNIELKEKNCCPSVFDDPSCNQQDKIIRTVKETDQKDKILREVSTAVREGEKNNQFDNHSVVKLRSDTCSNWRSQCFDVRERNMKQNEADWKNECMDSINQNYKATRNSNLYPKRTKNFNKNQMDASLKIEYVDDDPMVVVPLNLSEPPDPLSRFKNINADPESIWDTPNEKKMPCRFDNKIYVRNNNTTLKTGSKTEDVNAELLKKGKPTSVPRFFDNPTKAGSFTKSQFDTIKQSDYFKHSVSKIISASPVKLNENKESRLQSRHERYRSSSIQWRSHSSATPLESDVFFIIKIKNLEDGTVEKLKILKDLFLEVKKENPKLSDIIPYPGYKPRDVPSSACAVIMFVRCVFSSSYKIPDWLTAIEAFALAQKFGIEDLKKECQTYFKNYKIPSEQIEHVTDCAKQLQALNALIFTQFFKTIQNIKSLPAQKVYTPQSCSVSCTVEMKSLEFVIPLLLTEVNRGLEFCNESDITNTLIFRSLACTSCLTGIQLKFLTEDINSQLNISCEVFQNRERLFFQEFDTIAKSSIKITFEDEIIVKISEQIEICIIIEDIVLKMCSILTFNELVTDGKFQTNFESSKTTSDKNKLFCIEKVFYTCLT